MACPARPDTAADIWPCERLPHVLNAFLSYVRQLSAPLLRQGQRHLDGLQFFFDCRDVTLA